MKLEALNIKETKAVIRLIDYLVPDFDDTVQSFIDRYDVTLCSTSDIRDYMSVINEDGSEVYTFVEEEIVYETEEDLDVWEYRNDGQ